MNNLRSTVTAAVLTMTAATGALAAPVLEPTTQKFIDGLAGAKPIYTLSPQAAREVLLGAQSGPIQLTTVSIEDRLCPVGPTGRRRSSMETVVSWMGPDPHPCDPSGTHQRHASGDSLLPRCRLGHG